MALRKILVPAFLALALLGLLAAAPLASAQPLDDVADPAEDAVAVKAPKMEYEVPHVENAHDNETYYEQYEEPKYAPATYPYPKNYVIKKYQAHYKYYAPVGCKILVVKVYKYYYKYTKAVIKVVFICRRKKIVKYLYVTAPKYAYITGVLFHHKYNKLYTTLSHAYMPGYKPGYNPVYKP